MNAPSDFVPLSIVSRKDSSIEMPSTRRIKATDR